jgi:hypothetical protein
MRVSDVFTMGAGYGGHGYDGNDHWSSENPCYRDGFCHRESDSVDKYCDPRSRRKGLAHIIGTRKYGGAGLVSI